MFILMKAKVLGSDTSLKIGGKYGNVQMIIKLTQQMEQKLGFVQQYGIFFLSRHLKTKIKPSKCL